jgi:hypothetical protein
MMTNIENESVWAAGLAARLRLLQVDSADAAPVTRRENFVEEIGRALKGISPEKRDIYLHALADKFPMTGLSSKASLSAQTPSNAAMQTPEALLELLLTMAPQLDEETKRAFAQKLMEAGLGSKLAAQANWEIPEDIQTKLSLGPDQPLSPENAIRLLSLLIQEFIKIDTLTWETWSKLAPRSAIRREPASGGDLKAMSERFLNGEAGLEIGQLRLGLEKTRKIIAGLLAGIALGGKEFAEGYMIRFLPKNIEDVVHSRGMSIFGESVEKKCWGKYKELAYIDAVTIEKIIRDSIAKQAEEMARKT